MKSVLIGADILKLEDGYKLLEINTDTDLFQPDIPYMDIDPLFDYLTTNGYTKLVVFYKRAHIAPAVLTLLENKCNDLSITFETVLILNNSVTIPSITEVPGTFYLRCSYDVTAIIDDTYCRDKSEIVKLLTETDNLSIFPKTYVKYTDDDSVLDNLNNLVDNGLSPNLIAKKILPDFDRNTYPTFYKVTSEEELTTLKSENPDNIMLQEYQYNSANIDSDGQIQDVIRVWIVLLSDVETMIPLGATITKHQIPLNEELITYTGNKLDTKWRSMYFSNPNMFSLGVPANYDVIKIVDGNEVVSQIGDLQVGDSIKSIKLNGLSVSASMEETIAWTSSLTPADIITYETASVNYITKVPFEGWLVNIEYSNGSESGSTTLAPSEVLLIRSAVSSSITFETAYETSLNDSIITSTNLELPIVNKQNVYYSGSIVTLDIEPADVFVAGTDINDITKNNVGNIFLHNKCAWSGFCCVSEHTMISMEHFNKAIKDIQIGDLVWSYNFNTNEKELKEVLGIVSPMHDDIVEIRFNNGTSVKNTFDHLYYKYDGTLISYEPEKSNKWFSGNIPVGQMKVGDKCLNEDGTTLDIISINEEIMPIQTYTLFVKDNQNFYANGVLVYDEQK